MMLMYPEPTIPMFQVSINPDAGASCHPKLGETLREFRAEDVMILASGSISHNLGEVQRDKTDGGNFLGIPDSLTGCVIARWR